MSHTTHAPQGTPADLAALLRLPLLPLQRKLLVVGGASDARAGLPFDSPALLAGLVLQAHRVLCLLPGAASADR